MNTLITKAKNTFQYCDISDFNNNTYAIKKKEFRKEYFDNIPNTVNTTYKLQENERLSKLYPGKTEFQVDFDKYFGETINEGINHAHLLDLTKWIEANPKGVDIIFDWDRTLSCVEGIVGGLLIDANVPKLDTLMYLVGGEARFKYLKAFFEKIALNPNVKVYILTNNTLVCNDINNASIDPDVKNSVLEFNNKTIDHTKMTPRAHFLELIKLLIPQINDATLISTFDYSNEGKGPALLAYFKKHKLIELRGKGNPPYPTAIPTSESIAAAALATPPPNGGKSRRKTRRTKRKRFPSRKSKKRSTRSVNRSSI